MLARAVRRGRDIVERLAHEPHPKSAKRAPKQASSAKSGNVKKTSLPRFCAELVDLAAELLALLVHLRTKLLELLTHMDAQLLEALAPLVARDLVRRRCAISRRAAGGWRFTFFFGSGCHCGAS